MKRNDKEQLALDMAEVFKAARVGLLVDYRGLDMAKITEMRRKLHESAASMRVLKNRITKRALKGTSFEALEPSLTETRALIYGDEPVGPAKVLSKFLKDNEKLKYITGVLVTATGTNVLDSDRLNTLGNLPSREELLVKMLFVMKAVPTSFVRTLNEVPAKFVRTLAALAKKKAEG
ncbi:MAG: 50S ribosomal protein L10 [Deltaproteobacteria bacterium]|nr:50S ribosomal protein L10 [Deltaproteobacteria bacterium]